MTEDYVRPPIVAREVPSGRAAIWRFRAVIIVLLVALIIGVFIGTRWLIHRGEGNAQAARDVAVVKVVPVVPS